MQQFKIGVLGWSDAKAWLIECRKFQSHVSVIVWCRERHLGIGDGDNVQLLIDKATAAYWEGTKPPVRIGVGSEELQV